MRYRVLLVLVLLGAGVYLASQVTSYPDITSVSFTLTTGQRLSMQQLRGKPLIVSFWATSCASCLKEIPALIQLHQQYVQRGLTIIAVAMPYDRPDHVIGFIQTKRLPYPVALDVDARLVRAFGDVRLTPTNFLIGPDGRIIRQQVGILDISATKQWIQTALTPKV